MTGWLRPAPLHRVCSNSAAPPPGMGPIFPGYPDPRGFPRRDDHPRRLRARARLPQRSGQAARTVGAVISHGTPVDAGIITADGTRSEISSTAAQQLAHIVPPDQRPDTVELDGLGRYRVIAMHAHGPGRDDRHRPAHLRCRRHPAHVLVIFGVVGASR